MYVFIYVCMYVLSSPWIGYDRNNIKMAPYFFRAEITFLFFQMKNGFFLSIITKILLKLAINTPNCILLEFSKNIQRFFFL